MGLPKVSEQTLIGVGLPHCFANVESGCELSQPRTKAAVWLNLFAECCALLITKRIIHYHNFSQ